MAVYTPVEQDDLLSFLDAYGLGEVMAFKGIAEGVENSNFFLETEQGRYILTLYEKRVNPQDLPFFIGLMDHLADAGIPCPRPIRTSDGATLSELNGRPAAIISFLNGLSPQRPKVVHCAELGRALAQFHVASDGFALERKNALSVDGWGALLEATVERADEVKPGLGDDLAAEFGRSDGGLADRFAQRRDPRRSFPGQRLLHGREADGADRLLFRVQRRLCL